MGQRAPIEGKSNNKRRDRNVNGVVANVIVRAFLCRYALLRPILSAGGGSHTRKWKREKIDDKLLREGAQTPLSEPKSSQHWLEINQGRLRSDLGRFGTPPGRS